MKRIFCLILAILLLTASATPVLAAEGESVVIPRYSYIVRMKSALQIGTLGLSACQANCYVENADHIVLTVQLRQYNGSKWTIVKTWTATGTDFASISKNYAVPSGYDYCLRATCNVYNAAGTLIEIGNCYSNRVTY